MVPKLSNLMWIQHACPHQHSRMDTPGNAVSLHYPTGEKSLFLIRGQFPWQISRQHAVVTGPLRGALVTKDILRWSFSSGGRSSHQQSRERPSARARAGPTLRAALQHSRSTFLLGHHNFSEGEKKNHEGPKIYSSQVYQKSKLHRYLLTILLN